MTQGQNGRIWKLSELLAIKEGRILFFNHHPTEDEITKRLAGADRQRSVILIDDIGYCNSCLYNSDCVRAAEENSGHCGEWLPATGVDLP